MRFKHKETGNTITASQEFVDTHYPNEYELITEEVIALPITDIAVSETRFKVGELITFNYTTELGDEDHVIPYRIDGLPDRRLFDAKVENGTGAISFTPERSGVFYILNSELYLSDLHVNGEAVEKLKIHVVE